MKVVTNKIKNIDEYSITRYSISGIILKTVIFIILYIIYIYLGMYNFEEALSNKMRIKFIIGSLPFFIFVYLEAILGSSKEILFIKEDYLILKKYILFFCYYSKAIKLEDIRKIYCEKNKNYLFFSTDLLKNIKFRVKENEFEDKMYAFGYKLSEHESAEITNEIEENFEEIGFYVFYVNYLSKKEYENKKVLVGYNGVDGKEVTMSKFKEDINEIRDSRSRYGREVKK